MRKLPIGIQTFEEIIKEDYVYVDKTEYLYNLIENGKTYFLSRPRRFGKSLTISTLEAIFLGRKELFKGLYIYDTDYDWGKSPVIRIDMSIISSKTGKEIDETLCDVLTMIGNKYDIELEKSSKSADRCLNELIVKLAEKLGRVVILIDEYDKPILDHITKESVVFNREFLKSFYGIIKSLDEYVRFVFLTGVTKFSKVSVFSGLNNLIDLTMDSESSVMLGYTEDELKENFDEYIEEFANAINKTKQELLEQIRYWYNGFRFSKAESKVYNPFSTLLLLGKKDFRNYWFETATPTFLIELIFEKKYNIFEQEGLGVEEHIFSVFDIDNINVLALLFQAGYFTIQDYDYDRGLYKLGYPNKEVELAFTRGVLDKLKNGADNDLIRITDALYETNIDSFFERLKIFIASVPYTIRTKQEEKYYQIIIYTVLRCLGINVQVEVTTNIGRIDAVIDIRHKVFIIEFKLNDSKESALNQIKEKKYYEKFLSSDKEIYLIGAEIDKENKNIGEFVYELLEK